jgi:hypothetical protein
VILLTFLSHICFNILTILLMYLIETSLWERMFAGGFFPVVQIYLLRCAALEPEVERRLLYIPFTIKIKYLPYVFLFFSFIFINEMLLGVVCFLIGYLQAYTFNQKNIICLPYSFYFYFEKILCCLWNRYDFVQVSNAPYLIEICCRCNTSEERK